MKYVKKQVVCGVEYTVKEFISRINEKGPDWKEEEFKVDLDHITTVVELTDKGTIKITEVSE